MTVYLGRIASEKLHIGIIVSRFNEFITRRLLDSAVETLMQTGVAREKIDIVWVPGALEIPYFCQKLARQKKYDVLIALACVIRGETFHFECVSREVTRGIAQASLSEQMPIATGVLTVENLEQAIDRAGLKAGNKGAQAALAALEIADLNHQLSRQLRDGFQARPLKNLRDRSH
ncbi:MAG: 6,7-dimethyl-8-ribityllumazine synthase [Candidatus Omnitrophica bacterium]|nr:6,7-dimethyl-8-ribityllumazine synthase [Candidatus Omnitrophota bacterium]